MGEMSLTRSPAFIKVSMAPPREQQQGQTGGIPSLLLPLPLISLIPLTHGRPRPTPPSEGHAHLEVPPVSSPVLPPQQRSSGAAAFYLQSSIAKRQLLRLC